MRPWKQVAKALDTLTSSQRQQVSQCTFCPCHPCQSSPRRNSPSPAGRRQWQRPSSAKLRVHGQDQRTPGRVRGSCSLERSLVLERLKVHRRRCWKGKETGGRSFGSPRIFYVCLVDMLLSDVILLRNSNVTYLTSVLKACSNSMGYFSV